jgi:hypothetical protein
MAVTMRRVTPATEGGGIGARLRLGRHSVRRDGGCVPGNQRVRMLDCRTCLRQKERGQEEGVRGQFNDAHLALASHAADDHSASLEQAAILWIDTVLAVIRFGGHLTAIESRRARPGQNGHRFFMPDQ